MRTTISYPPLRMAAHLKRSRAPDKLACGSACSFAAARRTHAGISGGFTALKFFSCQGRRERLQQAAAPPSSAHFVSYAVAFYIAAYGSACSFAAARGPIQKLPGFSRTAIFQLSRVKCAEAGDIWHLLQNKIYTDFSFMVFSTASRSTNTRSLSFSFKISCLRPLYNFAVTFR